MRVSLLAAAALFVCAGTVYGEKLLARFSFTARECTVAIDQSEGANGSYFHLRPACKLSLESTRDVLSTLPKQGMSISSSSPGEMSVFLGRAEEYPWLSGALVAAALDSPEWNARRGHMRGRTPNINAFVADLLQLNQDLRTVMPGWQLASVSVEKVLVGPAEKYAPQSQRLGKAPFDAMIWLRLRKAGR